MPIQESKVMCKACAIGNEKYPHSGDPKTCIHGRSEYIRQLPPNQQISQLIIHERISISMANHIATLATERKKTPWEIVEEEGLSLV